MTAETAKIPSVLLGENKNYSDDSLVLLLREKAHVTSICGDGMEVIQKSFVDKPDLILMNVDLPLLNGYMCAKLLKNDPFMQSTPIIHMGLGGNPLEKYWSSFCQADFYLSKPVGESILDEILARVSRLTHTKRRVLAPSSILPDLNNLQIMALANNLLEQDLLRSNVLNEINMIDIRSMLVNDLIAALMTIFGSLFDFGLGAALLLSDFKGEIFFYQSRKAGDERLKEVTRLMLAYLKDRHDIILGPQKVSQTIIPATGSSHSPKAGTKLYIHSKDETPIQTILAFENIDYQSLRQDEQNLLMHALNLIHGVLEKKIFFNKSLELSIIDAATEGYSLAFFMLVLDREIQNASRNNYPISLFTIVVSNFSHIANEYSPGEKQRLTQIVYNIILKAMRKSDVVARWGPASFAFLLSHTSKEKALIAQKRIGTYIEKHLNQYLSRYLKDSTVIELETGIAQFDSKKDLSQEGFFKRSKPKPTV